MMISSSIHFPAKDKILLSCLLFWMESLEIGVFISLCHQLALSYWHFTSLVFFWNMYLLLIGSCYIAQAGLDSWAEAVPQSSCLSLLHSWDYKHHCTQLPVCSLVSCFVDHLNYMKSNFPTGSVVILLTITWEP
jgi:hypothetical protein